jgi:hypothetical protein
VAATTADGVVALRNTPCDADRGMLEATPVPVAEPVRAFTADEPGRDEDEGGDGWCARCRTEDEDEDFSINSGGCGVDIAMAASAPDAEASVSPLIPELAACC